MANQFRDKFKSLLQQKQNSPKQGIGFFQFPQQQAPASPSNPKVMSGALVDQPAREAYKKTFNIPQASGSATSPVAPQPQTPLPATPQPMQKSEAQLAQEELDRFTAARAAGLEGINQKVIPLEFQTGQKAALERNAALAGTELETRVGRLQSAEEAARQAKQQEFENDLALKKFEEDKRQFGMEYALSKQKAGGAGGTSANAQYRTQSMQNINNYVDEALSQVKFGTAGFGSGTLSGISGTGAKDLKSTLTTIKANIGFEALQAMREASKTGGALGQVAVQELEALQAVLGSIDQQQSVGQLRQNLTNIKAHYQNAMAALGNASPSTGGGITVAPDGTEVEIID